MAIKLKQYLENSWYRWASHDRQSWYAAQFQYWENINIRDMRNGVCLSWGATDVRNVSSEFSYFTWGMRWRQDLFMVTMDWKIYNVETWTQVLNLETNFFFPPIWIQFLEDYVYIIWRKIFRVQPGSTWTKTDVTPAWYTSWCFCALNYANTYLIFWDHSKVRRIDKLWIAKEIRDFDDSYMVRWLTQEGNYLKIYVSDWADTKIHYAKGTFDVEDTGLVQTVTFKWLNLWEVERGTLYTNTNVVTSDQWTDYAILQFAPWELKLAKISWYSKTDIRWTQTRDWKKIFTWTLPRVMASDWVLFAATDEWIWTFTEYNGWLWWWCLEFKESRQVGSMFRFWERLYTCIKNWNTSYTVRYYDLSFHPTKYQSNGFIVGRVFDWWCAWLFKKNDQATITYNMPAGTSMELRYRYDRSSFGYDKSNFSLIKKLEDTNECYDIVVPTTPSTPTLWLLKKEDSDYLITLENWDWILLEDLMVCPFNKTWNLLEYRMEFNTNNTSKTPTLYEHSLTYYDYMRKYR